MDAQGARVTVARILGTSALAVGLAVGLIGALYSNDDLPVTPYFFAMLFVVIGIGLRLEAAIIYRR